MSKTRIAVYGTLRSGLYNSYLMADAQLVGKGLSNDNATMYSRGGFPILSFHDGDAPVVVEVFEVTDPELARINQLEGYRGEGQDNWYDRTLKSFTLDDGQEVQALIFHQDRATDMPVVDGGDWIKSRQRMM